MKKIYFTAMLSLSLTAYGQELEEGSYEPIIDTLLIISNNTSDNPVWNYSSLNFSQYPTTTDIDLNQIQNVQQLFLANSQLQLNDSIVGELPVTTLTDGGLSFSISGNYVLKLAGQGDLLLTSDTIENVKQVIYTENYFLLHQNDSLGIDTVAYYTNTYFSFLNESTNENIFEVFNKKRSLKGLTNWVYNGISNCSSCINNSTIPDIQLNVSPNPTSDFTLISFTLPFTSDVIITLSNQENTVNEVLLSDSINEGFNEFQFMTQSYVTGSYTLTVTTSNGQYSTTLVIL